MKIVFFGTPKFAAEVLKDLVSRGFDIVAVVTRPDTPKGRSLKFLPPDVKVTAQELLPHIPLYQPAKASDPQFIEELRQFNADLFIVVAYGQILRQQLLDIPKKCCINIHASLLPKYRGAAPIQRAIIEGESETGITIMKMSLGLDSGDMLYQLKMPIPVQMNAEELRNNLCDLSKKALSYVIDHFDEIIPEPQNESGVTFAPKIEAKDAKIDWSQKASDIHNQVRGVFEDPGAYCKIELKGDIKLLKIFASEVLSSTQSFLPGSIVAFGKPGIVIATGDGLLKLLTIQLEGKKIMNAKDFACGYKKEDVVFLLE